MSVDDLTEDRECPLCMEKFEIDDFHFYPCTCKYQVCRFCWHRIRTDENGLCPACRTPYPEDPVNFQPLTPSEVQQLRTEKKQKEKKRNVSESRKHLSAYRVLQRNLVYVLGLSSRIADPELLKSPLYFGKYGKVQKVAVGTLPSSQGHASINTAYVTFNRVEDALKTILETNSLVFDGRMIKTSLGTTKYCSNFLRGLTCHKQECMYLHDVAPPELSFTKEDMHQGKHTEYERRMLEKLQLENEKGVKSDGDKLAPFELSLETERTVSPIMQSEENDDDEEEEEEKSDEIQSGDDSGASEVDTSFDTDPVYDYPMPSAADVHREAVLIPRLEEDEPNHIPARSPLTTISAYEDDLGFDPLTESLKGLEALLQEEERRPPPPKPVVGDGIFSSKVQRNAFEQFHRELREHTRRERETAASSANVFTQSAGFNGYQNGFGSQRSGRSGYHVQDNCYNQVPSDYYMYRPAQNYSPFSRQASYNEGPSMGRMSSSMSQGVPSAQNTYDTRDAFKALLPNVNVSFVSTAAGMSSPESRSNFLSEAQHSEMRNLFSSPNSFVPSSNYYSQDNYRGTSDMGFQSSSRQPNSYDVNVGRQTSSSSGLRWMVSPPPGFDNNGRSQGQG